MGRLGDRFEKAGIPNWMAHRARHYWATSAHRTGMSVFDIAAEGGWRDIKMVQRYTKARPFEELQRMPTPLSAVLGKRLADCQGPVESAEPYRNQLSLAKSREVDFDQ